MRCCWLESCRNQARRYFTLFALLFAFLFLLLHFAICFFAASQPVYPAASVMLCSCWLWFLLLCQSVCFFCVVRCPKPCQQDSRYFHLKVSSDRGRRSKSNSRTRNLFTAVQLPRETRRRWCCHRCATRMLLLLLQDIYCLRRLTAMFRPSQG